MAVDWLKASIEERKALHRVTATILKMRGIGWQQFFEQELKPPLYVAPGYHQSNFGKGTIARDRALRIFEWIVANHLDLAVRIDPALFNPSLTSDWRNFLERRGRYGDVTLVLPPDGRGIVQRADRHPVADKPVRLGQSFGFLVTNELAGRVLGLQGYRGVWFPIPLGNDDVTMAVPCQVGQQPLPFNPATGQPVKLREADHPGEHRFVFLVGPEEVIGQCESRLSLNHAILPETLDRIAHDFDQAEAGTVAVHRLNVILTNH